MCDMGDTSQEDRLARAPSDRARSEPLGIIAPRHAVGCAVRGRVQRVRQRTAAERAVGERSSERASRARSRELRWVCRFGGVITTLPRPSEAPGFGALREW